MSLAEKAVKRVLELGASEAEAYFHSEKVFWIEFDDKIECFKVTESNGLGLRAALGKKVASYSTSNISLEEIDEAAERVVRIAKVTPEDLEWRHFNMSFSKSDARGYYDESVEEIGYEDVVEKVNMAIERIREYSSMVKPARGILTISTTRTGIVNCYDGEFERRETGVVAWVRAKAEDGLEKSIGSEHIETRFWKNVNLEELASKAAENALNFLKAKPIESCRIPVIFRNDVFASILGTMLSGPITAEWVQKNRSPLAGKLEKKIACDRITLVDDGIMYGGVRTRPFDDEGYPTQKTYVIEKGLLKNYLYDTYTSLKDNVKSTGNAVRGGYWTPPQTAPSNLILMPGDSSLEEMVKETSRGLLVEDVIGEWLSNPVSGNLNATVTHAYLIEKGEPTIPVKGVMVSGDFYKMILEDVEMVGKDVRNMGQYYSPTIKFREITVAGK
ncbi:MAG: TldD/PmbA family protein [Nitrososphaeria archaeon]|nr:TldD/PmbA family protein [Nitrososphaeria archaeon]